MNRGLRSNAVYFLSVGLRTLERLHSQTVPLASLRNFLFLPHFPALGPQVVLTASVRALRLCVPDAKIALAASASVKQIFEHSEDVDFLIETPAPRKNLLGCLRAIRAANFFGGEPFAAVLTIGSSDPASRIIASRLGASGIVDLAGLPSIASSLKYDRQLSRIANDFRLIAQLGHEAALREHLRQDPDLWEPHISVSDEQKASATRLLRDGGLPEGAPYAVLITQARPSPPRWWRPEYFRQMALWLYQTHGLHIVFVGASVDSAAIERLREPLTCPSTDLSGKTTLGELAAVLLNARIGLCLDTGATHVARGVKLPIVVISPPAEWPAEWLPFGVPRARVLFNTRMRETDWQELPGELQPEVVQAKLAELLEAYPERTA